MTTAQREKYRQLLATMARRLKDEVTDLREEATHEDHGEESGTYPFVPPLGDEQPAAKAEGELVLQLLDREQHLLAQVQAALHRLDLGTFGTCEQCGKRIAENRLNAAPYAAECFRCAKLIAQNE